MMPIEAAEKAATNGATRVGTRHIVRRGDRILRSGRALFSERLCVGCGRLFQPRRPNQKSCTGACRARRTRQVRQRRFEEWLVDIDRALAASDVVLARAVLVSFAAEYGVSLTSDRRTGTQPTEEPCHETRRAWQERQPALSALNPAQERRVAALVRRRSTYNRSNGCPSAADQSQHRTRASRFHRSELSP